MGNQQTHGNANNRSGIPQGRVSGGNPNGRSLPGNVRRTPPPRQGQVPPQSGVVSSRQPMRTPPPKKENTSKKRNFILFAVLVLLIVVVIIISLFQSDPTNSPEHSGGKSNPVKLQSVTSAPDSENEAVPAANYAKYTDKTEKLNIESDYGILIDLDSNTVIASKKGDEKIYPASMTKMMTLIVAVENAKDLDDKFTFTAAMLDPLYAQNASEAGFSPGESVSIRDMLYGCVLPSGADATVGLANYIAGGEEEFAVLMNEKAKELGLQNTHFVTVSGLHDKDHYSTCHEMALILKYAISNPLMREILSEYHYTTSPTPEHPTGIRLTGTLYSRMSGDEAGEIFVQGGKTGYTVEGRNCLATFAARCSEELSPVTRPEYILVTASALGEYTPVFDAIKVYKWLGKKS